MKQLQVRPARTRIAAVLAGCFLLPAAVMTAVFAAAGLCPFGGSTMGVMDLPHQYLSFLYSLRYILRGEASVLYLPGMCLGGNMTGLFAYYLTSPLNLLTCLFPREDMYTAVGLLYILRVGLCGLTMGIYCAHRHGWSFRCLFPAAAFGLMAYMAAYCFNYLWQDSIILMPVIALGLSGLAEERRPLLYILSLGGALMLNFYIGYILCGFSVLFFLHELFAQPELRAHQPWKTAGIFMLSSLCAGCLAAVVLLPAACALSGGKAEFSLSALSLTTNFSWAEFFSKLYTGSFEYDEIMPQGLPSVFCGTLTTALAVLYFANRRISLRRRLLTGGLLVILAVSFWIAALDLIWHAMNVPSWYNYRYAFLFSFMLAASADAELAEYRDGTAAWHLLLPVGLAIAVTLYVFVGRGYSHVTAKAAIEAILAAAILCGGLWALGHFHAGRRGWVLFGAAVLLFHAGELGVNAYITLDDLTVQAIENEDYQSYAENMAAAAALVPDTGYYVRTESTVSFGQNRCEGMLFGYDGISHYGSVTSQKNLDFLDRLGFDRYTDLWVTYGGGATSAAESLMGIRYIIDDGTAAHKGYDTLANTGIYQVLENTAALPTAFLSDPSVTGEIGAENCFAYLNALYAAVSPQTGGDIFSFADVTAVDGEFSAETGGTIVYTLTVTSDGPLYAELEIPDFPSAMVYVNDAFCAAAATAQTNGSIYLGDFAAGENVTVKLQAFSGAVLDSAVFATENEDTLAAYLAQISVGGCDLVKESASHFYGTFSAKGDGLLLLTIPYDSAWRITVDGEQVSASEVQDCLTAICVPAGTHTIEMYYLPAGLVPGLCVTGMAIAALTVCVLWKRRKRAAIQP